MSAQQHYPSAQTYTKSHMLPEGIPITFLEQATLMLIQSDKLLSVRGGC